MALQPPECLLTQLGFDPLLGIHFLEVGVLRFELLQTFHHGGIHTRRICYAIGRTNRYSCHVAAQVGDRNPGLRLLQNRHDLAVAESRLSLRLCSSIISLPKPRLFFGGITTATLSACSSYWTFCLPTCGYPGHEAIWLSWPSCGYPALVPWVNARHRALLVAKPRAHSQRHRGAPGRASRAAMTWMQWLRRVYDIDVSVARMVAGSVLAVNDPPVITLISAPGLREGRAPPVAA